MINQIKYLYKMEKEQIQNWQNLAFQSKSKDEWK